MWAKASMDVAHHLQCEQLHIAGGSTLDSALVENTDAATLSWLVGALEYAHARGQTTLVGYLEAVVQDLVFSRGRDTRSLQSYIEILPRCGQCGRPKRSVSPA